MDNELDIAIVGMSCRFPGARNLEEFWQNLAGGIESITQLSDQEIIESGVPRSCLTNPDYVKAAPLLGEPELFDAAFFGFSPTEAKMMDPQHRILLELAYEALENAACDADRYKGRIGVYAGAAMNTYFMNRRLDSRFAEEYIPTLIVNDKDFLSTRISYKLNLKGPSITIQTACSTSLVATHLARQSLLCEETDVALVGAISVRVPPKAGYFYDGAGVVSPDGKVRAFDAKANGTVFGSGGGVIVLKRLADAIANGDTIYAVIKGSAVNNDGSEKAGYTAPSVNSQADAVVEALANAGVDADSITYIEAHGSGTPVGDPIEILALTKAFRTSTQRCGYCAIGSVKTNVGHLDAAAGIAGIIKTALALKHRMLPPSLNYSEPNPEIDFASTPFFVNTRFASWASSGPRRAGVMSTGMGGTNAHVVLEQSPELQAGSDSEPSHLIVLSAKTETALDRATEHMLEFIKSTDPLNMGDVAYTLQVGRKAFSHRRIVVCTGRDDAIAALAEEHSKRIISSRVDEFSSRPLILLLPGVGDHYLGMAYDLYQTLEVFRKEVDRCARLLEPHLGMDIREIIYPRSLSWRQGRTKGIDLKKMLGRKSDETETPEAKRLNQTLCAQPALFTIEYALARLWEVLGVRPNAIVGHSMGEYVAACLAGVLSLEDALRLIATRAKLVHELPQGAMLAVTLPEHDLLPLLGESLSIALINGPTLCVVAGPVEAMAAFERLLNKKGVICRQVQNAHAFHSRMLDPIVVAFEAEVRKVPLNEPRVPFISNVTGTWITSAQATDPAYWARHANHSARFSDALHHLWQLQDSILLEAGPGQTLGVLAMQHPDRKNAGNPVTISSLRHHYENLSDVDFLWRSIGKLWLSGAGLNWENLHPGGRRRISLPTYPFERQRYWIERELDDSAKLQAKERLSETANVENWFYVPTWERTLSHTESNGALSQDGILWLIISNRCGGGAGFKRKLDAMSAVTEAVQFGEKFDRRSDGIFEINPAAADDYLSLFRRLKGNLGKALNIVHLGCLTRHENQTPLSGSEAYQNFGFYSLLYIAQAIGELNISIPIKIGIISNRIHEVTGEETLRPELATVLGPCGVIPKEFPNVTCFNIDLPDDQAMGDLSNEVLGKLLSEFTGTRRSQVVAYRGTYRWNRKYERVKLPKPVLSEPPNRTLEIKRLRRGGVYLITGGTGGIGLTIAKYFARTCQPKIVLTKKTEFPEKARWRELLTAKGTPAPLARTIRELLEVEQLGAEVEVFVAEASDKAQMQRVLDETVKKFKAINGVIHAAGIVRAGLIQAKTKEMADSVLLPKVNGTMVLFELLKEVDLDFLVLFSSITSIITPYAESDYSAANSFLDAFTCFSNAQKRFHTLTINWPGWKEVGQLAELKALPGVESWKEEALKKAIATKDGLEAFKRALNSDFKQVVVSMEDLNQLLAQSQESIDASKYLSTRQKSARTLPFNRSRQGGVDQPANEVEKRVAKIWDEVFGFDGIGIHEDFSNLGGHSLLAMQIVSKIRFFYQLDFTLREFFEKPTIAQLSSTIRARIVAEIEGLSDYEAQQLISRAGAASFAGRH